MLGHEHFPVAIQADLVDRGAGDRPVRWRDGEGAAGEVFPFGAIAAPGGVHHAALHGAIPLDPGRDDPHQPILHRAEAWVDMSSTQFCDSAGVDQAVFGPRKFLTEQGLN